MVGVLNGLLTKKRPNLGVQQYIKVGTSAVMPIYCQKPLKSLETLVFQSSSWKPKKLVLVSTGIKVFNWHWKPGEVSINISNTSSYKVGASTSECGVNKTTESFSLYILSLEASQRYVTFRITVHIHWGSLDSPSEVWVKANLMDTVPD